MDTLPKELIEIILSMVPTDQLVTKFRAVNKSFFAISQKIVLEIGPSFKRTQTSNDHQIMVLARDYPSITSLDISKWDISTSALRVVFTQFPRLKTLKLPAMNMMRGNELLKHVIPSVTSLSFIIRSSMYERFNSGYFEVKGINTIFPNLEHLEICDSPSQGNIDDLLKDAKTIKSLTVHGPSIEQIANVPLLRTLTIVNNTKNTMEITGCHMLGTLNMMACDFNRFDFLLNIRNVHTVTLTRGYNSMWDRTDDQIDYMGLIDYLLQCCCNIKTLRIYQYKITSKHLERLVNGLQLLQEIVIKNLKYDENLPITALLLQEKHKNIKIIVPSRKFTTGIDLQEYEQLLKVEKTRDPFVECQHCHLQYQCAPEIHEEVCLKWPAWDCLFVNDGCGKKGMTKDEFRVHIDKCDYNLITCPFEECKEVIARHERHEHCKKHENTFLFRTKETYLLCPNLHYGCIDLFATLGDKLNHVSKCQHSHPLCMSCKQEFKSIDECAKHMSECKVTHKYRIMPEECIASIIETANRMSKNNAGKNQDSFHLTDYVKTYMRRSSYSDDYYSDRY